MGVVKGILRATRTAGLAMGVVIGLTAASAEASLSGDPLAFNDGNGPGAGGAWTTTTPFDNGTGLSGYIDWAVYGPGAFPHGGTGYTPTAGQLTYAFQVFSTGSDAISQLNIQDPNGAMNNPGSFTGIGLAAGEAPSSTSLGTQVEWNFAGLDTGENSTGLAFSSIKIPASLFGVVVNGGTFAVAIPLPVPGSNDIPEPASMALLGVGGLLMLRRRG